MISFLTRAELLADGFTRRSIQSAVAAGALVHVRRDRYLPVGADSRLVEAVRVGGRLTCLSLLAVLGVFVLKNSLLHVHVAPSASRLRAPGTMRRPLRASDRSLVRLHWTRELMGAGSSVVVDTVHALQHAFFCQSPRDMVATIDSALNRGLLRREEIGELFAGMPGRFHVIRPLIDGRAESGPETLVRLMARALGCDMRLQVSFLGIGRVDLVLDGWLVVECDSREHHSDWAARVRDHDRDLALAARGYACFRPVAEAIMYRPDEVFAALRGLILSRR